MTELQQKKNYLKRLKDHYNEAVKKDKTVFIFEDAEILTSYAKYLIEHIENNIKNEK